MLKLSFSSRAKGLVSFCAPFVLAAVVAIAAPSLATAAGGSWGGSGGFGSGGSGGGSWGGSGGGLFGGRQPIRNLLGRVTSRIGSGSLGSGGSRGGSFGGSFGGSGGGLFGGSGGGSVGGSTGGSTGGSWGSAGGYAAGSSGSAYGSWGSNYLSSLSDSHNYVSNQVTAPVYAAPVVSQPYVDMSSYASPSITGCPSCGTTTSMGIPTQQGIIETDYSSDTGFHDGSMPNYDGMPVDSGQIIDDSSIYEPGISAPTDYYDEGGSSLLDSGGTPPPPGPAGDDSTQSVPKAAADAAVLSIALPVDARVYINGRLTKTEGSVRNYVARKLDEGTEQGYQVKAILMRNGKQLVRTETVQMKRGVTRTLEFDFDKPVTTLLSLKVPANAKVRLCGAETSATGERRFFETSKLQDGESWDNYEIEVTVDREGEEVVARKTLSLHAGDSRSIVFDFQDKTGKLVALK